MSSFYPLVAFPVLEAPQWTKGYTVNICFTLGCTITLLLGFFLHHREEKHVRERAEIDEEGLKGEEVKHIE